MRKPIPDRVRSQIGFSLVEMITVMAIIAIMAAVVIPPLAAYARVYKLRTAQQQLASDISAAHTWALRFRRLGSGCGLNVASCGGVPANVPAYTNYIDVAAGTGLASVCLWQPTTNLRRWVNVTTGGRVSTQP